MDQAGEECFLGLDRQWPVASFRVDEYYLAFECRFDRKLGMRNLSRYCLTRPTARPCVVIDGRPTKLVFYDHQRITRGLIDGTRPGVPRIVFDEPVRNPLELARLIGQTWMAHRARNKHEPVLGLVGEPEST